MNLLESLTVLFIALKLCGVISWPWLWVLMPSMAPLSIALISFVIFGCLVGWSKTLNAMKRIFK